MDQNETEPKSEGVKQVTKISNGTSQNGTSSTDSGHPSSRNFSVTSGQSDSISTEDSGLHEPNLKALQLPASAHSPTKPNQNADQSDFTKMEMRALDREMQTQRTQQEVLKATQTKMDENEVEMNSEVSREDKISVKESQRAFKSTAAEPHEKIVQKMTTNKDRTAPVVEETVVPLVQEAFSRREMSEVQAPDESDESPSAIEMEDIPTANVCMAWKSPSKTSVQTVVPLLQLGLEEKTSPEERVSVLSEEPGMENICPQFDSLTVNAEKNEVISPVSSVGTTYSVSTSLRF